MKKLLFIDVYNYYKTNKCQLLEIEYKNIDYKMKYICSCGNISFMSFATFRKGHRCMNCSGTPKLTEAYIKNYFEINGCKLLNSYKNGKTKILYQCICGTISETFFKDFRSGHRCKVCRDKKVSGENNHRWIKDRTLIPLIKQLHNISIRYKQKYRRKYNIKDSNLHVDHIIPIKAFIDNKIYDIEFINSEDNLQILTKEENRKKWDNYIQEEFEEYIRTKSVEFINKISLETY